MHSSHMPPLKVHQARSPGPTASTQTHDKHLGVIQVPQTGAGDMPAQVDAGPNHRGSLDNVLERLTQAEGSRSAGKALAPRSASPLAALPPPVILFRVLRSAHLMGHAYNVP